MSHLHLLKFAMRLRRYVTAVSVVMNQQWYTDQYNCTLTIFAIPVTARLVSGYCWEPTSEKLTIFENYFWDSALYQNFIPKILILFSFLARFAHDYFSVYSAQAKWFALQSNDILSLSLRSKCGQFLFSFDAQQSFPNIVLFRSFAKSLFF